MSLLIIKGHYPALRQLVMTTIKTTLKLETFAEMIPDLCALQKCPQDPYFHGEGNVWIHTKLVLEALLSDIEFQQADEDSQFILFIAALLHDIAKPDTTEIDATTGRIRQPGHSKRGALDARIILWRLNVPFILREAICNLIEVHQLPFWLLSSENRYQEDPLFVLHRLSQDLRLRHLAILASADMRGREYQYRAEMLDEITLFKLFCEEHQLLDEPRKFVDSHTRIHYFRGANVQPDFPLFNEGGSDVILMAGLPATGKNYWVSNHHPDLPVASYDDAREVLKLKHGENEGKVTHYVRDQVKEWLRNHKPFVWNATHLSQEMREKALNLLYAYNASVKIVYLEADEKTILTRNKARNSSLSNERLLKMLFKWSIPKSIEANEVVYITENQ